MIAVSALAMVAGSLLSATPGAVAAGDPVQTADVAKGPRRTEVLAASGSVVIARAQETSSAGFTQWSTDGGASWEKWDSDWGFTPTGPATYAAGGKAAWIHAVSADDSAVTVVDLTGLGSAAAVKTTSFGRDKPEAATSTQAVVGRDGYQLVDLTGAKPDAPIRLDSVSAPKKNTYAKATWLLRPAGLLHTTAWSKKANGRITYIDIDPVAPGGGFGPRPFRISGYVPYVNASWKTDGSDGIAVIEYLRLSGTKLTWCTREWNTTTDALKKAVCKTVVKKTKKTATISAVRYGPLQLGITINGALKLWNGKKLVSVAKVSGHSLSFTGLGDPPAPLIRAEKAPAGAVYSAATNGKLTKRFAYFNGRVSPVSLDLTHARLAGLDGRAGYRAWTRAVGTGIAPAADETTLSGTTAGLQVSGSRSAQRIGTKLTLRDGDGVTGTATKVSALTDASGPYSLITRSKKTYVLNSSGAVVAKPSKSGNQIVAIFGSLAVEQSKDRKSILVRELSGQRGFPVPASQIPGAGSGWRISSAFVWGDLVVVGTSYSSFRTSYVYNWQLREWTTSAKDTVPVALGDGVAAVRDLKTGTYALWDLNHNYDPLRPGAKPFVDADVSVTPTFDGVNRFVYSTGTALKLVDLAQWDDADLSGTTAPRVLGTIAPTSYEINGVWRLALDASRPLDDGVVEILDAAGTKVAELPATGGEDGSIRVSWNGAKLVGGSMLDGSLPEHLVPDGSYTWRLLIADTDGTPLTRITGDTAAPSGSIKVTTAKIKTAKPKISGSAAVGRTLTASHSWSPGALAYAYQWYAKGVAIPGATAKTYTLTPAEKGLAITVRVTATNRRGTTATQLSKASKKVAQGKLGTKTPKISAKPKAGVELTVNPGSWTPAETTFTYQWYRVKGKKTTTIKGATTDRYTPVAADAGAKLKVKVTGKAAGYKTASKTSATTAKVAKG
ncbi:MAG: hypothetical protein KIT69_06245 [Propionibacteriaceae bacterium]|nr:hypothetical protein [Propionibacteriaceae bacterium]